jgi:NTE family protein
VTAGVGVVLAAGGERVVPWQTGVLAGLADAGLDLRGAAAIVGTSAGALVAARLALGVDQREAADRIVAGGTPEVPPEVAKLAATVVPRLLALQAETAGLDTVARARRAGRLALQAAAIPQDAHVAAVTRRLPAGEWPAALSVMAVDAESGALVRLGPGSGIPVGRAVAAARALPGILQPVTVGRRRLMDAVVASGTNADAVHGGVERVLVVTPAAADPRPGTLDAAIDAGLARERSALEQAGVTVEEIRPDGTASAAMGDQPYGIVDAAAALGSGRSTGRSLGRALRAAQMRPSRAA